MSARAGRDPSVEQFKQELLSRPLSTIVQRYIFEGIPYVFRSQPSAFEILRNHLSRSLSLRKEDIIIVGSAKTGFSLNPHTVFRQFSDYSDIDVAVVSKRTFDEVWRTILSWNYPRRYLLAGADWEWAKKRKEDLYWGWLRPDTIRFKGLSFPDVLKPVRDISTMWFNAFRSLSRYTQFGRRDVSGRLYRTWDHALLYHVEGLRRIRGIVR